MASRASQDALKNPSSAAKPVLPKVLQFALLILVNLFAIWFLNKLISLGYYPLAAVVVIITLFVDVVMVRRQAYPLRWMVVGLILMALFTIYPIIFTIWVAFTNYGEGHLITQEQAVDAAPGCQVSPGGGKGLYLDSF